MIKNVNISEDKVKHFVTIDIECDETSGVKSIQVVCLPEKVKEAQEFIFKSMQFLSVSQKMSTAAEKFGQLLTMKK